MTNGNVNEFIKAHPNANKLELVCFLFGFSYFHGIDAHLIAVQLSDVIKGLIYLHGQGIVHGNLNGVRVCTPLLPPA